MSNYSDDSNLSKEWSNLKDCILGQSHILSVRARNCLNQIVSIEDPHKAFRFMHEVKYNAKILNNCGRKTAVEIEDYLVRILSLLKSRNDPENNEGFKQVKAGLSRGLKGQELKVFKFQILKFLESKDVRSYNAIDKFFASYGNEIPKIHLDKIYKNPTSLKNVGRKSAIAIKEAFKFGFRDLQLPEREEANSTQNLSLFNSTLVNFPVSKELLHFFRNEEVSNIFKFISLLLSESSFFKNEKQKNIFLNSHEFLDVPIVTLDDLGKKVSVTRERVRQIKSKLHHYIFKRLFFIKTHLTEFSNYKFKKGLDIVVVNSDLKRAINNNCETNYSIDFLTLLLAFLNQHSYTEFGSYFKYKRSYRNQSYIKNIISKSGELRNRYLLSKNHFDKDEIEKLIVQTSKTLSNKIHIDKSYLIDDYLELLEIEPSELKNNIYSTILKSEFEVKIQRSSSTYIPLSINLGKISFSRNSKRVNRDYIIEALSFFGKPTHVKKIKQYIKEKYPFIKDSFHVSGTVMLHRDIFISFGRTSTYGLKSWETEGKVKGGTIRKIVEDYLLQYSEPKALNKIESAVLKWRPKSNAYSIISNLKLMNKEKSPFLFYRGHRYKNALIGLKNNKSILQSSEYEEVSLSDFLREFDLNQQNL